MNSNKKSNNRISRRGLLSSAGKIAVGAAGMAVAAPGVINITGEAHASQPGFPWGYKKIDPARAGKLAYEGWYQRFCCFGATRGILLPLQEDFGEPYTNFPIESTMWGHGGAVGWGSLCGSLNGAGMAISLLLGHDGEQIIDDVFHWYTETKLPLYKPDNPRIDIKQFNRSKSALCHISVGKWMRKEGVTFESPPRWERCARITADVAIKAVELMNKKLDGIYKVTRRDQVHKYKMPTENNCKQCHGTEVPPVPEYGYRS